MTVSTIRSFSNADLPRIVDVWIDHWSCLGAPPTVSMATIEQAILARTFFDPKRLLVAECEGKVRAWCHFAIDEASDSSGVSQNSATVFAFCFSPDGGREACSPLLSAIEKLAIESLATEITFGVIRDSENGYAGLPPVGYGIGVSEADTRTTSFLSDASYHPKKNAFRFTVSTSPYRPPVSREALQLRRTTRSIRENYIPSIPRFASALSHFDIERHRLVDHRTAEVLAEIDLWCSDVEAQVMNCSHAILDLNRLKEPLRLTAAEGFLIGSLVQTLADRRIYAVETVLDHPSTELANQLRSLQFQLSDAGATWGKTINPEA